MEKDEILEDVGTFNEDDLTQPNEIQFDKVVEEKPEENDKKENKTLLIAIAVIIVIFIISIAAIYFLKGSSNNVVTIDDLYKRNLEGKESDINYMYQGFSFVKAGSIWYTEVQNKNGTLFSIPIHFGPKELGNVSISGTINEKFFEQPLYITFDPLGPTLQYTALSSAELSTNLVSGLGLRPMAACDKNETNACSTRPIISSCQENNSVVYLKDADTTAVIMNGNCVIIQGQGKELVRATDRFLLMIYRIMN
jgi:hypothetical protein